MASFQQHKNGQASNYYPPYGQTLQQQNTAPQEYHNDDGGQYYASQLDQAGYNSQSQSTYPGMSMPTDQHQHLRSQSGHSGYTYPDSAYAIAGSRSRVETAESTLQPGKRIAPPQYGAPPPPPRPVGTAPLPPPTMNTVNPQQQQHAGYNQMQDHNYPTYTNGNAAPHDGKPVLPADEMGRGWLGFNMQDIRDLSPKAKKRLIW